MTSPAVPTAPLEAPEHPWPHRFPLGAVLLLALVAYATSFGGAFVFDDVQHVRDNLAIRDLGALLGWKGYLAHRHRFVGYLTFAVNHALGGLKTTDYHVVNFAIHAVNAARVYALALLAFRTPRLRGSALAGSAQAIAFAAAALFATHPLQTQAVTYVVQRFTSLATLFYLLSVVLFLRWRLERESPRAAAAARAAWYAGVLLALVLGMKTKEIAFTAPLAIALCEWTFFEPTSWRRRAFLAPILATLLVIPASYVGSALWPGAGGDPGGGLAAVGEVTRVQTTVSRADYLLTQAPVVLTYLRLLAWPAGLSLDHDVAVAHRLLEARVLGSGLALVALAALAVVLYRRTRAGAARGLDPAARLVAFGIAWFFLALAVESSFVPIVDVLYEHRVYLPSAGAFVAVVVVLAFLLRRVDARRAATALAVGAAVLAAVLAIASFRRNRVWASELTIWSDAAAKAPGKARPHFELGSALCVAGRLEEGARELRRSIELGPGPDMAYARAQLGAALVALGRPAEAEPELREAVRLKPSDPEAMFNLAVVLARTGRRDEARPLFARFLEVAPESAGYARARRIAERGVR